MTAMASGLMYFKVIDLVIPAGKRSVQVSRLDRYFPGRLALRGFDLAVPVFAPAKDRDLSSRLRNEVRLM